MKKLIKVKYCVGELKCSRFLIKINTQKASRGRNLFFSSKSKKNSPVHFSDLILKLKSPYFAEKPANTVCFG